MTMSGESFEPMLEVDVLPASAEDALPIQQLIKDSWLKTFVNDRTGITEDDVEELFKNAFKPEVLEHRAKELAEPTAGVTHLVAKEADTKALLGYCRVKKLPIENLLDVLHVASHIKNRGIGSQLWEKAQGALDPTKDTALWVEVNNEDAIAVYRRWGFAEPDPPEPFFEEDPMKSGAHRTMMKMVLKAEPAVETLPEKLDVIFELGGMNDLMRHIQAGDISWAAMVDLKNGMMYIGDSHTILQSEYPISRRNFCKASLTFDLPDHVYAWPITDHRVTPGGKLVDSGPLRDLILRTARREVLRQQT